MRVIIVSVIIILFQLPGFCEENKSNLKSIDAYQRDIKNQMNQSDVSNKKNQKPRENIDLQVVGQKTKRDKPVVTPPKDTSKTASGKKDKPPTKRPTKVKPAPVQQKAPSEEDKKTSERPEITKEDSLKKDTAISVDTSKKDSIEEIDTVIGEKIEPDGNGVLYYILASIGVLILVILIVILLRRLLKSRRKKETDPDKKPTEPTTELERLTISDKPVSSTVDDRLGTASLVKGLASFLINKNTKPPLTIAITGKWGSGKSSIMGMLKDQLKNHGLNPIWFNAWHHHSEDHLFGALLETIRRDAIPPIWSLKGVFFRLRLLLIRCYNNPIASFVTIIALVCAVILLPQIPKSILKYFLEPDSKDSLFYIKNSSFIGTIVWIVYAFHGGFSTLGISSGKLVRQAQQILKNVGGIRLQIDPGNRYRINRALGDISWALGRKPLTVFIDDLDRCPPGQVIKVLEVINFLSSSPRQGYIILGMDLEKVVYSISGEFDEIVAESIPGNECESTQHREECLRKERVEYAQNYLEKMINVEINIHKSDPEALNNLVSSEKRPGTDKEEKPSVWQIINDITDKRVFPVLIGIAIVYIFFFYIPSYINEIQNEIEWKKKEQMQESSRAEETTAQKDVERTDSTPSEKQEQVDEDMYYEIESQTREFLYTIAFGSLGAGTIFTLLLLLLQFGSRQSEVKDDPEFTRAIGVWSSIISMADATPRHFKRVVNQLRLLSMRCEVEMPDKSKSLTIPKFIALRALQGISIDIRAINKLLDANKGLNINEIDFAQNLKHIKKNQEEEIKQAIVRHNEGFPGVWPNEEDVETFEKLTTGITLR